MGYVVEQIDPTLDPRLDNLENNEYKITYYEIVSGASGSLTVPTGATINAGEFGLSGNAILSKIDGSNKPTFQSPVTSGGVVVTASLNITTGAWVASGTYTDANVALIYSIEIKALYYANLTYSRIIETINNSEKVINNISKLSSSGKYIPTKLGFGAVTATTGYGNGTYTCYKIEANDTVNVTSLSVYVTTLFATGKIRLGIYSDNNGLVGTLIQQTAELDASSTGLKEGTITTTTLDKSTTYWFVIQQNSSVIGYYFNAVVLNDIFKTGDANGRFYYSAITYNGTYGSLPSTISGTPTYNLPAVGTNIVTFLKIA